MRAYLTHDDRLVVRDAVPGDAMILWRTLRELYLERRGPDPAGPDDEPVPATTYLDVIEVVCAFEGVAQSIRCSADRGLDDWRHGFVRTFELIARSDDRHRRYPYNEVVWHALTRALAAQLAAREPEPDLRQASV